VLDVLVLVEEVEDERLVEVELEELVELELVEDEDDVDVDDADVDDAEEEVLELVVVDDCIIASTKVMPFSPMLVEKEYCWDDCAEVTTLYPHALAIHEVTETWSPSVSGDAAE